MSGGLGHGQLQSCYNGSRPGSGLCVARVAIFANLVGKGGVFSNLSSCYMVIVSRDPSLL